MKRVIKLISLILSLLMLVAVIPVSASAVEPEKDYPYILIHGIMGWGEDQNEMMDGTYWGFGENQDVVEYMRSQGYKVYSPSVGKISSAWDRACELYAEMTGTVVDYGEAHSELYGHARYGRDYTGRALMGQAWDTESPVNIITHSFGGPTAVIFCSLLENGCAEEIAASGDECSPLFKGGHPGVVYSVSTCEAPLNGTQTADFVLDIPGITLAFCTVMNLAGTKAEPSKDYMLDQWGLTAEPDSGNTASFNPLGIIRLANSKDNAAYDMTIKGAAELNERFPTAQGTYWFSYSACLTEINELGIVKPTGKSAFLNAMSLLTASRTNVWNIRSGWVGSEWKSNDGFVPVISAQAPFNAKSAVLAETEKIEKGVWYTNPVDYCVGHGNHVSGTNEVLYGKYDTIVKNIASAS